MSGFTCPEGHTSGAGDYCDVCGSPISPDGTAAAVPGGSSSANGATRPGAGGVPPGTVPPGTGAPAEVACPHCGSDSPAGALFCEDCGYDFTTGALPEPDPEPTPDPGSSSVPPTSGPTVAPPVPVEWVVEVWVDPEWFAVQQSPDPCPSPGMPVVVPMAARSLLIGRRSVSRGIDPQVDCSADIGVSRRHAQLTGDGQRWWIEDLQSANGTYLGRAGGPMPTDPLAPGRRHELADDERIYLGAWTRLVVRRAAPGEVEGTAAPAT